MTHPEAIKQAALEYTKLGFATFPLPWKSKQAAVKWSTIAQLPLSLEEVSKAFERKQQNIGVICGQPSGNLLAIDCDTPRELKEQRRRLEGLGIFPWLIQRPPNGSQHDGGGTFLMRTDAPARSTKTGDADILGEGRYFAAPPSEHPRGGSYSFAERRGDLPTVEMRDLAWLELHKAESQQPESRIPRKAWRILQGDEEILSRYEGRSEAEAALMASLYNVGFTLHQVKALLDYYPGTGHWDYEKSRGDRQAMHYLRQTWDSVTAFVYANQRPAQALAKTLAGWAEVTPWPGRSGANDRKVYLAHCEIVLKSGNELYHASARTLAELAGIGRQTAIRCNHRLQHQHQLIELAVPATFNLANKWNLLEPQCESYRKYRDTLSLRNVRECPTISDLMGHDAFRWGALNATGAEVLAALFELQGEVSEIDLVERTGRHIKTVRSRLNDLHHFGIVEPLGERRWQMFLDFPELESRLTEIAIMMGSIGKLDKDKQRHARERRFRKMLLDMER